MSHTDQSVRRRAVSCIAEGLGVRPTARVVGVAINTVQGIIRDVGPRCRRLHDEKVRNLACSRIEADELHAFCYARKQHLPEHLRGTFGYGDLWTWPAVGA